MKKKLLTSLICLAGSPFAMAAFPDYDYTLSIDDVVTRNITDGPQVYSITTLLDVEKLASAVSGSGTSSNIIKYTALGTWQNATPFTITISIVSGAVTLDWSSRTNDKTPITLGESLENAVDWSNVYAAAITLAHDPTSPAQGETSTTQGTSYLLSLWSHGSKGLTEIYARAEDAKFSAPITQVSIDDCIGQTAYVFYGQKLSEEQAKAANIKYIPEPATATLSLLALAGMASRRRRK